MFTLVILIFMLVFLIAVLVLRKNKGENKPNDFSGVKLTENSPIPEKTNDYKFHKYIEKRPEFIIESYYKMLKERRFYLKPEFEKAIEEKLLKGEYKNPINFETYFGNRFDFISLSFSSFLYNEKEISYFLEVCYVKNNIIATDESFLINPPSSIFNIDDTSQITLSWNFEQEVNNEDLKRWKQDNENNPIVLCADYDFKTTWNSFMLRVCIESNLLIFWDKDFKILVRMLLHNKITEFNFQYIIFKEIAQAKSLPTTIDDLLSYYKIEKSESFVENLANIYLEFCASMTDIHGFIHHIDNR